MSRTTARATALGTTLVMIVLFAGGAFGMFAMPSPAPVDRLIRNIEAYIKEHPKDAQGYYALGRVHYLAFSLKSAEVGTFGEGDGNKLPAISDMQPGRGRPRPNQPAPEPPKPPTEGELAAHVAAAIANFRKATETEPKEALFHQGLAWVLEQGAPLASKVGGFPPGDLAAHEKANYMEPPEIGLIVRQLGDKNFKVRDAADKFLRAKGSEAVNAVTIACRDSNDTEVKTRAEAILAVYWKDRAIDSYYAAYSLAIDKDLKITNQPIRGLATLVGYESGQRYIALVKARGTAEADKERIDGIEKNLKALQGKPPGPITPIVFNLEAQRPLADLLAKGKGVKFDLDGTGRGFTWPWVAPTTGILVWDPQGTGKITSGHQLFGSVTWSIFWPDGYRAMDALDDNRDGVLSGEELRGLAVWFDRNGNGVSDPGEVVPIEKTAIRALRTRATGRTGESPFASDGLRTLGGAVLPTYDWTTAPLGK